MDFIFVIFLFILVIDGFVAYFISRAVYRQLIQINKYAIVLGIITFIISFAAIGFGILLLLLYLFPFER